MNREEKFFNTLRDVFVGAKIEGESGYINLMRIKSRYYTEGVFPMLQKDINEALKPFPSFRDELFEKLYDFFQRYFSESGSIYFRYTPLHQNVYEKVYTDDKDVMLFWKTHMLFYVKTDRLFKSMEVEVDDRKFFFDVAELEHKKANEKRTIVYSYKEKRKGGTLVFTVAYSEKGKKTKTDDILKTLRKNGDKINEDTLERAFRVFEKQSEVDYFINKDAKAFLSEQFNLWMFQYIFSGVSEWTETRIKQLQTLRDIAFKIIAFISQFENELLKIWNKPKFVLNSNYVITLDRIAEGEGGLAVVEKLLAHSNFKAQVEEWKQLGIVEKSFKKTDVMEKKSRGKRLAKAWQFLPVDTKHFKDMERKILGLFDDLDASLDGWLIKSENYQALVTITEKFRERVSCVYIDPPYNATTSEIPYVNTYKDSSWISMMENRLMISKQLLSNPFIYVIAIDDVEQRYLGDLISQYQFPSNKIVCVTVVSNRRGQQGKNFSYVHEYAYFIYPDDKEKFISDRQLGETDHRNLRDSGGESLRRDAKNCFYPIILAGNKIIGFGKVPSDDFHPKGVNVKQKDGAIEVWPIDTDGGERKWRYARQSVEAISSDLEAKETREGIQIYYNKNTGTTRTVWQSEKYDASEYGTKTLQDLFTSSITDEFEYPKSVHLVEDSIKAASPALRNRGIILDYFAGSGTTGHAIINLNRHKQGSSRLRYVLIEMGEHFDSVLLPRIKKTIFSENWDKGKDTGGLGISHFVKYFKLEQYEDALRRAKYKDGDLFDDPNKDPYHQYVFLRDRKMLEALDVDTKKNTVKVDLSKLYDGIDIAETLSNLTGKWIKRIAAESIEFEDGEVVDTKNLDWRRIKPLIWW
ncbi:MAG: DNA methyltransferase [Pseudomonadota bacterium]